MTRTDTRRDHDVADFVEQYVELLPAGMVVPIVGFRGGGNPAILTYAEPEFTGRVVDAVRKHRHSCDLYINTCAMYEHRVPGLRLAGKRGERQHYDAVIALWADLDIAGPNHATDKKLPADADTALAIARSMPWSALIRTGGGIDPWALLADPIILGSDDERIAIEDELTKPWVLTYARRAWESGEYVIDEGVGDLARLLRLPGSLNHKPTRWTNPQPPQEVVFVEQQGLPIRRYDVAELIDLLDPKETEQVGSKRPKRATATTNNNALNVLSVVDEVPWSAIWPSDWTLKRHSTVKGAAVEHWVRPNATTKRKSATCWVDGGCHVHSDNVPGLPAGSYSRAEVLAWTLGLPINDMSRLAKRLCDEAFGGAR